MFKNDARFTHSGDPDGRRALALVKPEGALFTPKPGDHRFKGAEQIPEKGSRQPFKLGLPEKEISLPDPLVQQAIARTLAGVSSKGFQLLSPKTMAEVSEIAKTAPRSKAEERDREDKAKQDQEAALATADAPAAEAAMQAAPRDSGAGDTAGMDDTREAIPQTDADVEPNVPADAHENANSVSKAATVEADAGTADAGAADEDGVDAQAADASTVDEPQTESASIAEEAQRESSPAQTPVPEGMRLVSAADIQQMFDEAFAQGQEAVLQEAEARMQEAAATIEQERQAIEDAAYQRGYDEGHAKAETTVRDELQAEVELAVEDLRDLTARIAESAHDTNNFYAPMLKLATHLAEQLVRGELTLSGEAIARLVQTSLEEFDKDPSAPVMVRLNPEDLTRLEGHGLSLPGSMTLKADATLTSGSVRVQMNGALIEDLIEDRAAALWHSLTVGVDAGAPPRSFLQNVALVKEAFDEVDSVIDTAVSDDDDVEDLAQDAAEETK